MDANNTISYAHAQTFSHVFTCYELESTVVSRWISTDYFLDFVGCQVKQIQVIFHRKTFLEAIFETDVTYTKITLIIYSFIHFFTIKLIQWIV